MNVVKFYIHLFHHVKEIKVVVNSILTNKISTAFSSDQKEDPEDDVSWFRQSKTTDATFSPESIDQF